MSNQELINSEFAALINDNELVFVDYWAPWCAPCKHFSKIYDQVSGQFPQINFAKINIDEDKGLAKYFEIRSIPHLMIFKNGIVIYSDAGSLSESTLIELAQQAIEVDISEIKDQK